MSKNIIPLGSTEWVAKVFATRPVRAIKGRSKATQCHQIWSARMSRMMELQGRNEATAALLLEYLTTLGHIARYKEQPFRTLLNEFGYEIVPDFIATDMAGRIYVIEVKTARFITPLALSTLERNRETFSKFGITYLWWTDTAPLNRHLRSNLIMMRRHAQLVPDEQRAQFATHIYERGVATVSSFYDTSFDTGVLYASAWAGETAFPINRPLHPQTFISLKPTDEIRSIFLGDRLGPDSWWNSLKREG